MTLRLILVRHAKSDWDDPLLDDHDRPLNKRGRKSADRIGAWLATHELIPDQVLCSDALRATQTWEALAPHIANTTDVRFDPALYLAAPRQMLDILRQATGQTVLMIGHNPGIAMLAAGMSIGDSRHPDFNRYPTCATAVISFPVDTWASVEPGTGTLDDFIVPRSLLG